MFSPPQPDIICTHESDLDGLLSGLLLQRLARHLFQQDVPLQALHNHAWRNRPMSEKQAWVCDLSFDQRLDKPGWLVIDHHPVDLQPKRATLIHDTSKSAAVLVWELCREHGLESKTLDRLVHLSNIADLFLQEDPDFVEATDLANLVKTYGFWNLHALIDGNPEALANHPLLEVMSVKRRIEDPLGFEWSKKNVAPLSPSAGYVETVVGNVNLVVHRLLEEKATPFAVLVTLFRRGNGVIIASFRSRNGEALALAHKFQGGGHPNASGATLPRSLQQIPDALRYMRQILQPPVILPPANTDALESAAFGTVAP